MTMRSGIAYSNISPYGGPPKLPTKREMDVIRLLASGLKNKEIAKEVGTTEHVIKNKLRVIFDKLGMWNRVELALWYVYHYERPKPIRMG